MTSHATTPRASRAPRRIILYLSALLFLVVLALTALTWLYVPPATRGGQATGAPAELKVGAPAPEFQLKTLDGNTLSLSSFKGQPLWLNFWSTTCGPCKEEMPDIVAVSREARERGVRLLAVDVGENPAIVRKYLAHTGYSVLPVAVDEKYEVAAAYNVYYMPMHVFIDSKGIIRRVEASKLSAAQMRDATGDLR